MKDDSASSGPGAGPWGAPSPGSHPAPGVPGWGLPTTPPPPGPPPNGAPTPDRGRRIAILVLAFVFVASTVGVVVGIGRFDDGFDHPDDWDERVVDLVAFVEREREHTFTHPVTVQFLDADEYREATVGEDVDQTDEEIEELERLTALYRTVGFVNGDVDLAEAFDTLVDSGTLAFYSPATKEIVVRGTEITVDLRVTLVHELTHALQDQIFDLGRMERLEDHAASVLRDVAEGDATRIEHLYVEQLDVDEHDEYVEMSGTAYEEVLPTLEEAVPPLLLASFRAPYDYGLALVTLAHAERGTKGIDALFTDVPSEFAAFDPMGRDPRDHLASEQEELEVEAPEGADEIDTGTFGSLNWYILLAGVHEPMDALGITATISADGYVEHESDGRVCLAAVASSDDPERLADGLQRWAEAVPDHDVEIDVSGDRVALHSCDPGPDATHAPEVDEEVVMLPAVRTIFYAAMLETGLPDRFSRCFTERSMEEFTLEEMFGEESDPAVEARAEELLDACTR